jgi:hypothetical protein
VIGDSLNRHACPLIGWHDLRIRVSGVAIQAAWPFWRRGGVSVCPSVQTAAGRRPLRECSRLNSFSCLRRRPDRSRPHAPTDGRTR